MAKDHVTQTKRRVVKAQGGLFLERISQLTLESVREHELTEASPAEKAADIGAGEQQVALTVFVNDIRGHFRIKIGATVPYSVVHDNQKWGPIASENREAPDGC